MAGLSKRNPRKRPSAAEMNRRRAQIEESEAQKGVKPLASSKDLIVKIRGDIKWDSPSNPAGSPTSPSPYTLSYQMYINDLLRQSLMGYPYSLQPESPKPSPLKLPRRHITTPIVGYRSWKLTMEPGEKATLRATGVTAAWKDTAIRAECVPENYSWGWLEPKKHKSPSPNCRCGIYAYTHPKPALANADQVHGAIVAWGRVVEHGAEGFRAANAQIIALGLRPESMFATYHDYWKADQLTREGARRLKVPVVAVEALELYAREFGEHLA